MELRVITARRLRRHTGERGVLDAVPWRRHGSIPFAHGPQMLELPPGAKVPDMFEGIAFDPSDGCSILLSS